MSALYIDLNKRKAALVLLALLLTAVLAWGVRSWPGRQAGARPEQRDPTGALALRAPHGAPTGPGPGGKAVNQARSTVATIGRSVKNDLSPALRTMPPLRAAPQQNSGEGPENPILDLSKQPRKIVDTALQTLLGPQQMPTPEANIEGIAYNDSWPPDPNGDVGPDHYVQWVNRQFQI